MKGSIAWVAGTLPGWLLYFLDTAEFFVDSGCGYCYDNITPLRKGVGLNT